MRDENTVRGPFVRVVGTGCDITIEVESTDDINIVHRAVDLAFERYKKENESATINANKDS